MLLVDFVRYSYHCHVKHCRMSSQNVLDFRGRDIYALERNKLGYPINKKDFSVFVIISDIAGAQPTWKILYFHYYSIAESFRFACLYSSINWIYVFIWGSYRHYRKLVWSLRDSYNIHSLRLVFLHAILQFRWPPKFSRFLRPLFLFGR